MAVRWPLPLAFERDFYWVIKAGSRFFTGPQPGSRLSLTPAPLSSLTADPLFQCQLFL